MITSHDHRDENLKTIDEQAAALESHGITIVPDPTAMERINKFSQKIAARWLTFNQQVQSFSDALLEDPKLVAALRSCKMSKDSFQKSCGRTIGDLLASFRSEIPLEIPRSSRVAAREFVIDWTNKDPQACWYTKYPDEALIQAFGITDLIKISAIHSGGQPAAVVEIFTELTLAMIKSGQLSIPRLTLIQSSSTLSQYRYEDPVI